MTTKTLEAELRTRFDRAITSLSTPAVLIGPKWLRPDPSNKPGAFEFVGVPKIAKALGCPPERVLKMLLQRVGAEHLGLSTDVTGDLIIRIFPTKTPARELKQAAQSPATAVAGNGPAAAPVAPQSPPAPTAQGPAAAASETPAKPRKPRKPKPPKAPKPPQ